MRRGEKEVGGFGEGRGWLVKSNRGETCGLSAQFLSLHLLSVHQHILSQHSENIQDQASISPPLPYPPSSRSLLLLLKTK